MIKKLTNNIFYMPNSDDTDRPILGLICGEKYSLIVDSGNSPNHAKEFLAEVNLMNIPPVKYLVLTHHHWDHVFGIREMNLTTIAHEKTKEEIGKMKKLKWDDASLDKRVKDGTITEFSSKCIKEEIKEREDFTMGDVDITYNDSIKIDLGGLTCILKAVGGAHTDDSTLIYIPEEKVMFLGDCAYGSRFNGLYGYDKEKLLTMIDIIEKYNAEYYILSHESLCDRKEISDFWKQLNLAEQIVGKDISVEISNKRFIDKFKREPSKDEAFFITCFINANKSRK